MSDTSRIPGPGDRLRVRAALVAVVVAVLAVSAGCAQRAPRTLELAGSVVSDTVVVVVPDLPQPSPDLEAGFASAEETPGVDVAFAAPTDGGGGVAWARVASVSVKPGDTVAAGQVVAALDDAVLAAEVSQAEADASLARANAEVVGMLSEEASQSISDIAEQRSEIASKTAELQLQRAELQAQLDQARALVGSPVPTGTPDPAVKVAELEAAIAEVDTALNELQTALQELNEASSGLGEARTALEALQRAMEAMTRARDVGVEIAEAQRARTRLIAPVAGTVVSAVATGTVAAPGAPLVVIQPAGAVVVRTYVTAEQREMITRGSSARIVADSMPGQVLAGAVLEFGADYGYVPTSFATKVIHLVRGLEVRIIVYGNRAPPPGTPVDVSIDTLASTSP